MIGQMSRYAEIIVKVAPARVTTRGQARPPATEGGRLREAKQTYDVLIYANLPLPMISAARELPPGQPDAIAGIGFVGVEQIEVKWSHYKEYLAAFVEGIKVPEMMRERLVETMSPGLEELIYGPPLGPQTVRLWWSSDTPELEDLPWELLTQPGRRNYPPEKFSFVRGLPPETPVPILPLEGRPRLGFIHDPQFTPRPLLDALLQLDGPELEVVPMPEHPRKSLERAVAQGFELLHVVADGVVSSAYEGILYFHGGRSTSPELPPRELSATLRGSRVSVLGLTGQDYSDPDTMTLGDWQVPSVYRAFAYLGGSRLPMPTVVAPLGPLPPEDLHRFWKHFYRGLADTFSPHRAMVRAQKAAGPTPVAVFLRHPQPVLFRRVTDATPAPAADPTQLGAELQLSHELVQQLEVNSDLYGGLPESVRAFIVQESARQAEISSALDPWLTASDEEGQQGEEEGDG